MDKDIAETQSGINTGKNQPRVTTEGSAQGQRVSVLRFTAIEPGRLLKCFSLGNDGKLVKSSGGNLIHGNAETKYLYRMATFAKLSIA